MRTTPKLMDAVVPRGLGLRPRLTLSRKPVPRPGPDDVLVEVHAASVNPKDWKLNSSIAALATPMLASRIPPLFGDDLAGVVVARGRDVTEFSVGDAVYGMDMRLRTASLAEYAVIHRGRIAHMPAQLSFGEAAAMPLAALTALQGLRDRGKARQGSRTLIIGASGGVGTFAVQIAAALGCVITAVCSGRNAALVRDLGAHHVIDYTREDFHDLKDAFDIVFDVTAFETPGSCKAILAPDGYFVSTAGHPSAIAGVLRARDDHARFIWVNARTKDLQTLAAMVEAGQLKPIIDSHYPLASADEAYQRSQSGRARGKIVIDVRHD